MDNKQKAKKPKKRIAMSKALTKMSPTKTSAFSLKTRNSFKSSYLNTTNFKIEENKSIASHYIEYKENTEKNSIEVWKARQKIAMKKKQEAFNEKMNMKQRFIQRHVDHVENSRLRAEKYYNEIQMFMTVYLWKVLLPYTKIVNALAEIKNKIRRGRIQRNKENFNAIRIQKAFKNHKKNRHLTFEGIIKEVINPSNCIWVKFSLQLRCQTFQIKQFIEAKALLGNFFQQLAQPKQC